MELSSPSRPAKYVSNTVEASTTRALHLHEILLLLRVVLSPREQGRDADDHRQDDEGAGAEPAAELGRRAPERRLEASLPVLAWQLVGRCHQSSEPRIASRGAAIRSAVARSCSTGTSWGSSVISNTRCATALGDATTAVPPRASTDLTARMSALIPLESMNVIPGDIDHDM